jgi:hypothetical protein
MMVLTWLYISTSDNLKALFIPNREERVKLFLRNEKSPQKYRKNNNAANYIEIFNIPTMLVVIVFQIHDTYKSGILFLALCCLIRVNTIAFKLGATTRIDLTESCILK